MLWIILSRSEHYFLLRNNKYYLQDPNQAPFLFRNLENIISTGQSIIQIEVFKRTIQVVLCEKAVVTTYDTSNMFMNGGDIKSLYMYIFIAFDFKVQPTFIYIKWWPSQQNYNRKYHECSFEVHPNDLSMKSTREKMDQRYFTLFQNFEHLLECSYHHFLLFMWLALPYTSLYLCNYDKSIRTRFNDGHHLT